MAEPPLQLAFSKDFQDRTNWCWAATAKCISHSYDSHSTFTQCIIARTQLGTNICSSNCSRSGCNVPERLKRSLEITGNYKSDQPDSILWSKVKSEISAGRYVCAWINWNGLGGHFVSICGVGRINGSLALYIYDSADEDDTITLIKYSEFKSRYNTIGTWEHTFFTDRTQPTS